MLESKIEAYLKKRLKSLGVICWKFESPGMRGVPDRIIILPGNTIAFVETKAPGKTERAQQEYRHKQLRRLGCQVFNTVDSHAKVDRIVEWAKEAMGHSV